MRFSEPNSKSLISSRVHEKMDASSRPIMTTLTITVASMNIEIGVMPPPWCEAAASSAGAASAAGAASGVAAPAAGAVAGVGSAGAWARTGELAIRAAAPAMARRIFVFLLFSIVRQFLLGLTRGTKDAAIVSDRIPT
ncbi:hypothetical protein GCM10009081_30630 [Brevundimonas nasdae]